MTPPAVPGAATSFSERLRERRRASGKSQADLAGADLSPSYVSLLEAGKRTPTLDVVGALAGRLDCTVEYLLRGEDPAAAERLALTLRYSELALQNGEAQDALTQIDELLRDVSAAPADMVLRARHLKAKAREALGDLEAAIADLEILARDANDGGRVEEHLRLTIDLVRCYQEAGDVAYALDIGRTALDQVERLGMTGSDVHAELVSTVVGAYYVRGDLVKAGMLAERAVHDVEHRGSARARAAVYWNASLVAESADRISDALILAERAVALYAEGDDARAIARLRIAYGWLLLRSTPPQGRRARDVLQQA
ncbi:MAG: helix-turn-helix domain-containing protein, partial [Actinomycetes bacterium]